jgi:hypothetical protein
MLEIMGILKWNLVSENHLKWEGEVANENSGNDN